jgi:hypothetical protein
VTHAAARLVTTRLTLLVVAFGVNACGTRAAFQAETAPGFVEVREASPYDFRAVAPDGVAFAVRAVPLDGKTDLAFWTEAFSLRMRELEGYALLSTQPVRAADGTPGQELVFGHDEGGKPFLYRVRLFVARARLLVVEAGGADDQMQRWKPSVDWMLASVHAL